MFIKLAEHGVSAARTNQTESFSSNSPFDTFIHTLHLVRSLPLKIGPFVFKTVHHTHTQMNV